MKKEKIIVSILISIIVILWFTVQELLSDLYFNSFLPDPKIAQQLKIVNNALKIELLQKESYNEIEKEAKSSGFVNAPFVTP